MRTFALQRVPDGFELDAPPFRYWVKAGMGFTLGAGIMGAVAAFVYFVMMVFGLAALGTLLSH